MTIRMLLRREVFPSLPSHRQGEYMEEQMATAEPMGSLWLVLFSSVFKGRFSKEILFYFVPGGRRVFRLWEGEAAKPWKIRPQAVPEASPIS